MKWLTHALALLFGALVFWLSTSIQLVPNAEGELVEIATKEMDVSYSDFISVLLTVVTVVLAAVGLMIAVVAAYTVSTIKEDARTAVDEAVEKRLAGLKKDVAKIAFQMGRPGPSVEELEEGFDPEDTEVDR